LTRSSRPTVLFVRWRQRGPSLSFEIFTAMA
jgi:hypothetical protein